MKNHNSIFAAYRPEEAYIAWGMDIPEPDDDIDADFNVNND